jgi:hypothetical protein
MDDVFADTTPAETPVDEPAATPEPAAAAQPPGTACDDIQAYVAPEVAAFVAGLIRLGNTAVNDALLRACAALRAVVKEATPQPQHGALLCWAAQVGLADYMRATVLPPLPEGTQNAMRNVPEPQAPQDGSDNSMDALVTAFNDPDTARP